MPQGTFSLEELVALAREGTASIAAWVPVFTAGQHREGERVYTLADLDTIVANFRLNLPAYLPPVVIGHEDEQEWLADTGVPKAGDVVELRRVGDTLEARLADLPRRIADAINLNLYSGVSVEIWPEPDPGLQGAGPTLRRIALLGGWPPQVKGLQTGNRLPTAASSRRPFLTSFRRLRQSRIVRGDRGRVLVYSELIMDQATKDTLIAVIKGKWSDLSDDFLASLDDAQLQTLAASATPAGGSADAGAAPTQAADAPSRDQMVADLVAAGMDQAAVEAMDEAALLAAWQEKQAAAAPAAPMGSAQAAARHGSNGTFTAAQVQALVGRAVAAALPAALNRAVAAFVKPVQAKVHQLDKFASERLAAEKKARVTAELDALVQQGRVLPAERDGGLDDVLAACDATAVHKYASSDGKGTIDQTQFDRLLAALKARPVLAKFGDRFRDPVDKVDADAEEAKVRRYADNQAFAATLRAAGKTPEQFVERFKELRKKQPALTARKYGVPADAA